ncbi:MAG: rRNA maturation RNase YbeY [Verrucomicrobiaceae bacterium]
MSSEDITLHFFNHQSRQPSRLKLWRKAATRAVPHCLAASKSNEAVLHSLKEIEISFVSDKAIARVHGEFLDDPAPTDVITFPHGEIIISLDTAQRQSAEHQETYEREVALYIIHGLLHLAGWDDHEESERHEMHARQLAILSESFGG